jgi:hypothetical protein
VVCSACKEKTQPPDAPVYEEFCIACAGKPENKAKIQRHYDQCGHPMVSCCFLCFSTVFTISRYDTRYTES